MLIDLDASSRAAARIAIESHDGLAAKYSRIVLCAGECEKIEEVAAKTGWPSHTVQGVVERYRSEGNSFLNPRPKKIKPLFKNRVFTTYEGPEWEYYNGALLISSLDNSKAVMSEIMRLIPDPLGKRVLDIGAGEGAFAMMLRDHGFVLDCVDVNDNRFVPQDIPFIRADINKGLSHVLLGKQYELIIAVEVVGFFMEPYKFFEESFALLRPGGCFLMTMNNTTNFVSRAVFATDGIFTNSLKRETSSIHHPPANTLPWFTYERMLRLTGFDEIMTMETNPMSIVCLESWKHMLRSFPRLLMYFLSLRCRSDPRIGKQVLLSGRKPVASDRED